MPGPALAPSLAVDAPLVSIVTVTLNRPSLATACESIDRQTMDRWHHYVIGDGVAPRDFRSDRRSTLGFSRALGAEEPGLNMPDGTPNPLQRWCLKNLDLAPYVCFLDDDNAYLPAFLERMVRALDAASDKGVALCGVQDIRYGQNIDGHPWYGACDNSGVMYRRSVVKAVEFPRASVDRQVIQDCEYIEDCAKRFGWVRVPEILVRFGVAPDLPSLRGGVKLVSSWQKPLEAERLSRRGEHEKAETMLEEAIALDPKDAWSIWKLFEARVGLGRMDRALSALAKWLELTEPMDLPPDPWVWSMRAAARRVLGRGGHREALERALALADSRIQSDPSDPDSWIKKGTYLLLLGDEISGLAAIRHGATLPGAAGPAEEARLELSILSRAEPRLEPMLRGAAAILGEPQLPVSSRQ